MYECWSRMRLINIRAKQVSERRGEENLTLRSGKVLNPCQTKSPPKRIRERRFQLKNISSFHTSYSVHIMTMYSYLSLFKFYLSLWKIFKNKNIKLHCLRKAKAITWVRPFKQLKWSFLYCYFSILLVFIY